MRSISQMNLKVSSPLSKSSTMLRRAGGLARSSKRKRGAESCWLLLSIWSVTSTAGSPPGNCRASLMGYAASPEFNPGSELKLDYLDSLFRSKDH